MHSYAQYNCVSLANANSPLAGFAGRKNKYAVEPNQELLALGEQTSLMSTIFLEKASKFVISRYFTDLALAAW